MKDGDHQFFVKWLGFPASQNSWEPAKNILNKRLITEFYKQHPRATCYVDPNYTSRVAALLPEEPASDDVTIAVLSFDESWDDLSHFPVPGELPGPKYDEGTLRVTFHGTPIVEPPLTAPTQFHGTGHIPPQELQPLISQASLHTSQHEVSYTFPPEALHVRDTQVLSNRSSQRKVLAPRFPTQDTASTVTPVPRYATMVRTKATWPQFRASLSFFWLILVVLLTLAIPTATHEYDEAGQKLTFFPDSLMIAMKPRPLIFFNDTKLVSIHTDLHAFPRGGLPTLNTTCDPVQTAFYERVLNSVRGIQRTTHRLYSLQGVTSLLECDSFLRRFYQYSTGVPLQLFCATRHYANNLHACKTWARRTCRVTSADELAWLRARERRSPFVCHMGSFGLFRAFYQLVTKHSCDTQTGPNLIHSLRDAASTMSGNQQLTRVVNGKVTYLVKTTDILSTKIKQLITSVRDMDRSFATWSQQVTKQFTKEECHYQANMEFISLYSLHINRAMSAMLRLTEIEDILRQLSHLTRKNLISFADLPRFLTMELNVRLSAIPPLRHTLDALKSGFAAIMQPLVDYEFTNNKKLQLNLLLTLPEIPAGSALCTVEQLLPINYQNKGHCFGGPLPRADLSLLMCGTKRFVLRNTELDRCFQDDTTILCPANVLDTVTEPHWLGLPWTPDAKLQFTQLHQVLSHCLPLQPLLLLGGRYYLSTSYQNVTFFSPNTVTHLSLSPLTIIHVPCNVSFTYQKGALGTCPDIFRFSAPLLQETQFTYIPWNTVSHPNVTLSVPDIPLPQNFDLDNSTLVSLDHTYNTLDHELTSRLNKFNTDIDRLKDTTTTTTNDIFTYLTFALSLLNLVTLCIAFGRIRRTRPPLHIHSLPLSTQAECSTGD